MIRTIFSRKDIFLLFTIFFKFLISRLMTMCKCEKKGNSHIRLSNLSFNSFFLKNILTNIIFNYKNQSLKHIFKIANQPQPKHSPSTSSQESPVTPTTTQNPQTSTRKYFQGNPYTFEERHERLSEPLEPVHRQAPLSEPTH